MSCAFRIVSAFLEADWLPGPLWAEKLRSRAGAISHVACLGGWGRACLPAPSPTVHPAPSMLHSSRPEPSLASPDGSCPRGGRGQLLGASWVLTTPGYKGLGQESSFHRAQGEWASKLLPVLPLPQRSLPRRLLHLPRPDQASCWGEGLSPSCSVPPRTSLLPGEAAPFLPEVLERCGPPPGWEGSLDLMAAPLRILAPSVAGLLAQAPWVKPLAVHTCRDQVVSHSLFQGTLLPGRPERAMGA